MTDKQKAIELSIKVMEDGHFESNGVCQRKQIANALMQMAEWKDNKFYLILACIKVSLKKAGLDADKFIDEIKKQWEE